MGIDDYDEMLTEEISKEEGNEKIGKLDKSRDEYTAADEQDMERMEETRDEGLDGNEMKHDRSDNMILSMYIKIGLLPLSSESSSSYRTRKNTLSHFIPLSCRYLSFACRLPSNRTPQPGINSAIAFMSPSPSYDYLRINRYGAVNKTTILQKMLWVSPGWWTGYLDILNLLTSPGWSQSSFTRQVNKPRNEACKPKWWKDSDTRTSRPPKVWPSTSSLAHPRTAPP